MKEFDIGFVPEGWDRGEKLRIRYCGDIGEITQAEPALLGLDEAPNLHAVYSVRFNRASAHDVGRVNAWLTWWREV